MMRERIALLVAASALAGCLEERSNYIGLATHGTDAGIGFPLDHDGRMEIAVARVAR